MEEWRNNVYGATLRRTGGGFVKRTTNVVIGAVSLSIALLGALLLSLAGAADARASFAASDATPAAPAKHQLSVELSATRLDFGQVPSGQGAVQSALTIGSALRRPDPLSVQHHFDGLVDEAMIYDRALTDAEVAALAKR